MLALAIAKAYMIISHSLSIWVPKTFAKVQILTHKKNQLNTREKMHLKRSFHETSASKGPFKILETPFPLHLPNISVYSSKDKIQKNQTKLERWSKEYPRRLTIFFSCLSCGCISLSIDFFLSLYSVILLLIYGIFVRVMIK